MSAEFLSPRLYEVIIAVIISALCFFLKRLVDSLDKLTAKVEALNLTLVASYATKDEVVERIDARVDPLEASLADKIKLCELKHHRLKEAS